MPADTIGGFVAALLFSSEITKLAQFRKHFVETRDFDLPLTATAITFAEQDQIAITFVGL